MHAFTADHFKKAFETQAITHFFQPIVDLHTQAVLGFEALARWHHPEHGLLVSSQFIHALVEAGYASRLSQLAFVRSKEFLFKAAVAGRVNTPISINITASEFENAQLLSDLSECFEHHPELRSLIKLEMLEWGPSNHLDLIAEVVNKLLALGIAVYADDFGHAFGSFHRLLHIPYRGIKLDAEYATNIGQRPQAIAIVQSLVGLSHDLSLNLIVEGVQTAEQADTLKRLGVHSVQGHLFDAALTMEDALLKLAHK